MSDESPVLLEGQIERGDRTVKPSGTCNQRCVFCSGYPSRPDSEEEILEFVKDKKEVFFDGGEPTLNDELFRYAEHARSLGVERITLLTNGLRLASKEYAKGVLDSGINRIFFALPSHRRGVGDLLSRVEGSHEQKLKGLRNLTELGAADKVLIVHLLNRQNCQDLPEFVRFVHKEWPEIRSVEISLMQNPGDQENLRALVPSLTEVRPFLEDALNLGAQFEMDITVNGIPPCIIPEHQTLTRAYRVKHERGGSIPGRRTLDVCESCPLSFCCFGVREDYLKIFGSGEIKRARQALEAPDHSVAAQDETPAAEGETPAAAEVAEPSRPTQEEEEPSDASADSQAVTEPEDVRLHLEIVGHLKANKPTRALDVMRKLLSIRGAEPSPDQLRVGVARQRLTESTTLRGFKPAQLVVLRQNLHAVTKLKDIEPEAAERFFDENRRRFHIVRSAPYVKNYLGIRRKLDATGHEVPFRVVVYASQGDAAYRLREVELKRQKEDTPEAWREVGRLLDFPTCCVEHYVDVRTRCHDQGVHFKEALVRSTWKQTRGRSTLPFETSLFSDLNLIPFFPCSFRCEKALQWAGEVLKAISAEDVQLADAYFRACSQPALYFRQAFYVLFEGRIMGETLYYGSFAVNTFGPSWIRDVHRLFYRDVGRLLEHGDRLTVTDRDVLISRGEKPVARLIKEQPDACLLLAFST